MKKRILAFGLAALLAVSATGCGKTTTDNTTETTTPEATSATEETPAATTVADGDNKIVIGVTPVPHKDIADVAKAALEAQGYEVEIVEYNDYVQPNTALEEGDLDANYFQTLSYLESQNEERGLHLLSVASIHAEPMGIYSKTVDSLENLPDGATIAIPNDTDNEGRALHVLADAGLITVPEDGNIMPTDITENPHNFTFVEIEASGLPRQIDDVDAAIVNGNYALGADLGNTSNVLYTEEITGDRITLRGNIIAVKEGTENTQKVQDIIAAFQSEEVKQYINDTYAGAVIPVF
jgi:D-methionine transport system substrate-binding protein